jgi:hypothetical protein
MPADTDGADRVLELLHRAIGVPEKLVPFKREGNRTVSANQELNTEHILERADLAANRRLRDA